MGDPFSFDGADPNAAGFLGQSPQFWRDLAAFGGNLAGAANARTASGHLANGTGFAGPLGVATVQTMEMGQKNALARSLLQHQGAQTQGLNINNEIGRLGLPFQRALAGARMDALGGMGGQPMPGGQMPPPTSLAPGRQASAEMPAEYMPFYQEAAARTGIPIPVLVAQARQESEFNPNAIGKAGEIGLHQILPSTAKDPGFGLTGIDPATLHDPRTNINFAADYLKARGGPRTDFSNPATVDAALKNYNGGGDPNYVANVRRHMGAAPQASAAPTSAPAPYQVAQAGALTTPPPQQAQAGPGAQQQQQQAPDIHQQASALQAEATHYEQLANRAALLGNGIGGDPTVLRQTAMEKRKLADQLLTAGPMERQKAMNSNVDIRANGQALIQTPNGSAWVKNPGVHETQDANGNTIPMHVSPPVPGSPPGSQGTAEPILGPDGKPIITKLPANLQDARNKAYSDFAGKDTDSYLAAQNTHSWLEQMNHAAEVMNAGGGFLGTGPTAPHRLAFAATMNDILRTAGLPEAFDPTKVSSWEELKKATTTAGFELSSHYEGHARQAAQTIVNATSAVPSAENSPEGFKLVSAGIQEAAQNAIDLHNYKQTVYDQNGDLNKAEVEFYKQNPAQAYARRAISMVKPYEVATDKELNRYLPGTFVVYKGHKVQVPAREGAPPVPSYLAPQ